MCEAIRCLTARAAISLPTPTPGTAVSLAITVNPLRPAEARPSRQAARGADSEEPPDHDPGTVGDYGDRILEFRR